ncbi:lysine 2,3-aminomutase [Actinosynnema sp. NPDC047251]|uniref:Lysine 2,3-aminomutase-like protein n=1 Tax=Saccharothrix espanaensis (strain ATCC 51144 / DSM 44229 / JCM 9112 / NBRC 15066 / NRRL 15764) TaxID=1179773 RepID=K0K462_SACES|nr:Lysine 2,3-aminomutase-like protein [Saccharothrix espanaensis]CCH32397.1 Lysine 2,3-aminomutase-like protein [Saccharothrix espanaensis DSM 44229]
MLLDGLGVAVAESGRFTAYGLSRLRQTELFARLPAERRFDIEVVSQVLPFRVNDFVLRELIDWDAPLEDPVFRLTFPHRDMLAPRAFEAMAALLRAGAPRAETERLARSLRAGLNPHPAGQQTLNVPELDGNPLPGVQHKYANTVLFFPSAGQTCHSYCTFCFRWPQFVGAEDRFSAKDSAGLAAYLRVHPEVSDLLVTGGDPMVMRTHRLAGYLEPLLADPGLAHVRTVRIGTKSLTFWPHRYVLDEDADDLLALFRRIVDSGRHVALMAHVNHWREMESPLFAEAVARIRATGAVIRTQAPLLAHINDDAEVWATLWERQVNLGMVPYYMFVERDTGADQYFQVPLERAARIYADAVRRVGGLARTARGPSMSCGPGKVEVQGVAEVRGERVFVLRFLQGRRADWANRPFFAAYDPSATWFDQLRPAFGEPRFFFSDEYDAITGRTPLPPEAGV